MSKKLVHKLTDDTGSGTSRTLLAMLMVTLSLALVACSLASGQVSASVARANAYGWGGRFMRASDEGSDSPAQDDAGLDDDGASDEEPASDVTDSMGEHDGPVTDQPEKGVDDSSDQATDNVDADASVRDGGVAAEEENTTLRQELTTANGQKYAITAAFGADAAIPEGAELRVAELVRTPEDYEERRDTTYKDRPLATERFTSADELARRDELVRATLELQDQDRLISTKYLAIELIADGVAWVPQAPVTITVSTNAVPKASAASVEAAMLEGEVGHKLGVTNKTQQKGNATLSVSTTVVGELALACVAAPKLTWDVNGSTVTILGPRTGVNVRTEDAEGLTVSEGQELVRATRVQADPEVEWGTNLWVEATRPEDVDTAVGVVGLHVKDGMRLATLFGVSGTKRPVALRAGSDLALVWDSGLRQQTLESGDVTLDGLMPKGAEAEAADVTDAYPDVAELTGDEEPGGRETLAAYDVAITKGDETYQPTDEQHVGVTIANDGIDPERDVEVWQVAADGSAQQVETADVKKGSVSFEATGEATTYVLTYTVDFHWGEYTYNLAGGSEMLLSQLFEILKAATQYGADGELNPEQFDISIEDVSEVRFSDPALLEISKIEGTKQIQALADQIAENSAASENEAMDEAWLDEEEEKQAGGYHPIESASDADENPDDAVSAKAVPAPTVTWDADWLLTSLAPFTSDEALTLTLKDGRTLDIHVTDAVSFNYQGLTYQTINNNTTNVKVVGYQSNYSGVPTIPATISYNGTTYTVTDLTYFGTARTLKNKNLFFETGMLDKMANNAVIGMPEMVAQMDAAMEQSLLDQGFMPGAQNDTADQLVFKKAVYSPETNSITYEIKYFQPMKQNQPLDFIFGIDQSGTMCTHDATASGIRAPRVIWMMALLQRTAYELVSKNGQGYDNKVAFVPWGSEKVTPVTDTDFLGNATQIDAWFQGPKPYSHAAEGTNHGRACDALADAAALSIKNNRTPIVIYMSDFVSFAGSNRTQRDRLKLAKFNTYSFVVFNGPHTDFSENWSNSGAYASDEPAEFMGIFRNIVLDAIGYYMKGDISVTDTMPDAISDAVAAQKKADGAPAQNPGTVNPSKGKVTWQLGNQNPLLESGTVHTETFTAKLDDNTIYSGAMPTNGDVKVTVNGKEVNSVTPKDDDPDHLHRGGDVVFLLGRLDKKAQISTDNKGVPTTLTEGIRFTLKRVGESETIKTEASPDGLFTTDGNGSFAVPYKDKDGKVIFGLGERFVLHEDADSVSDYNEGDAHDEKLVAPDKDWIITVSESGIITMAPESAAGQTPPATVADAVSPNPPRLVIWNQIVVEATLIPVTVQKVWPDNDHPHDPVPFTVYGVDPNKTYEERKLTAYDGKNVASAKQLKYIAPGNVGFTESADGLTWTQVVYVPDSETTDSGSYQYYDDKIMSAENTHNYHVNQQAADLDEYDALDGETDGNITYDQQYSYIVREGDLIYPYGWYTPEYNNNVSESKRTNTRPEVTGGTANFVAYDNGTGSTTVEKQTVTGGTGTLDGKNLSQNFQFHIAMGHFEYKDSELSYDDLETYFGFSFTNHEKTHNAVKDIGSGGEVRNFFTHIGEITVEFSKADGDVTKNYTLKFKPDVGNYFIEDNDIVAPAAHDAYTFRGIALPSDWADDYTAVKRDLNTRTWFRALNGITYKKITMTSNVDSSKKIIVYSNKSTDTDNKLYWNWAKYDQLGDRPELEVMVSGERYHRITSSNLSQSLSRNAYETSGTDPKPLTDTQYNRNVVIYAPPVLDITNHWTRNPLAEVKVTKNWMNDDSGTPQPYGEDIYNVKQDVSFHLKGTTTAGGTKDVPIFDSDDAGWYNGTSSGSDKATIAKTADNQDSATWEKSFYVPTYDVLGTYDPETRTCEAYTFDDSSLTEVGLDVARDEDGEPKGEWQAVPSFEAEHDKPKKVGWYEVETTPSNYKYFVFKHRNQLTIRGFRISFTQNGTKYRQLVKLTRDYSLWTNGTYYAPFLWDGPISGISNVAIEKWYGGNSYSDINYNLDVIGVTDSVPADVNIVEDSGTSYTITKYYNEEASHVPNTFTLTNTYTPYKEVNLTSTFTDSTNDRESTKSISSVVYTVKQGETVVRTARTTAPGTTTDGNPVVRGLSKTVYLPKGTYTVEQTGYTLTGEEQVYSTVAFTTENGTTRSLNIQSDTGVAYNNTRKNLPIEVKMAWEPTLAADEDPLQQSGKTLPYAIHVDVPGDEENDYQRSGSYTREVNGASESINGKYQMEYARQENSHGAGIPSYSIRGEQSQCSLDRSEMENALPDYTLEVLTEETAQKLVFTIQATIRKADIRVNKEWLDIEEGFTYPDSLTFTLTRSDGGSILGTTQTEKNITITNPGDPAAWSGVFEDIPVLRSFGHEKTDNVKYILTETDDEASSTTTFGRYYTTYVDDTGMAENQFESVNPKDKKQEYAAFRLNDGGIYLRVQNAEGPYICKIEETFENSNGLIEHPFRTLNKAVTYARNNKDDLGMDADHPIRIQMLVDYVIPSTDKVTLDKDSDNIIFTTAATSGGVYNFTPTFIAAEGRLSTDSGEKAILKRGYSGGSLFTANTGAKLTVEKVVIDGDKDNYHSTNNGGLTEAIGANTTLTITTGAELRNSRVDNDYGKGGAVYGRDDASVTMNGGVVKTSVTNQEGGGIKLDGGSLTIEGSAVIENCQASHGGGVHVNNTTTFIRGSAEIKDCTVSGCGGGVYVHGGYSDTSPWTEISGNAKITNCSGGGWNGTSYESDGKGGGVNAGWKGKVKIAGNARIENCKALHGGGVNIEFLNENQSQGTIEGSAVITGCEARDYGSGVGVEDGAILNMAGGSITGNTVSDSVGAVEFGGENARINLSGTPNITGNETGTLKKNVVLNNDTNSIIQVHGALGADASIGIYVTDTTVTETFINNGDTETEEVTLYSRHGDAGTPFGTWAADANLNKFVNDRNELAGIKKGSDNLIYWKDAPAYLKLVNRTASKDVTFRLYVDNGNYHSDLSKRGNNNQNYKVKAQGTAGNYYYEFQRNHNKSETLYLPGAAGKDAKVEVWMNGEKITDLGAQDMCIDNTVVPLAAYATNGKLVEGPEYYVVPNYGEETKEDPANCYNQATANDQYRMVYLLDLVNVTKTWENVTATGEDKSNNNDRIVLQALDKDGKAIKVTMPQKENSKVTISEENITLAKPDSVSNDTTNKTTTWAWKLALPLGVNAVTETYVPGYYEEITANPTTDDAVRVSGDGVTYLRTIGVTNTYAICKIVETKTEDGNTVTVDHPFSKLTDAVTYARNNKDDLGMDADHSIRIQMLADYVIPSTDKVTLNKANDNIIITTAATSGGVYNFTPTFTEDTAAGDRLSTDGKATAILKRGSDVGNNSLFTVSDSNAFLRTENIIFDGAGINVGTNGTIIKASSGSLTIAGNTMIRNSVANVSSGNGGAIYAPVPVTFTTEHGETILFKDCTTNKEGGVIETEGNKLTINNKGTLKAVDCSASSGGFICTDTGGEVEISNSGTIEVTGCQATSNDGGAIFTGIFKAENNSGNISFTNCTSAYKGGAIVANRGDASADTFVLTNTATGTASFTNCSAKEGGAVYVTNGKCTITGADVGNPVTFEGCTASGNGGAIYQNGGNALTLTNVTFGKSGNAAFGCSAASTGGAIYTAAAGTLTDCSFNYCKTTSGSSGGGGAIFYANGIQNLYGCVFDHCEAAGGSQSQGLGGAIKYDNGNELVIDRSDARRSAFTNCTANRFGGAIAFELNGGTFEVKNTDFTSCVAASKTGGAIGSDAYTLNIVNSTFNDCKAENGTGGAICAGMDGVTPNVQVENSVVTGCASPSGAAIYSKGDLTIRQTGTGTSEIKNCSASGNNGGAVNVETGKTMTFEGNVVIYDNKGTGLLANQQKNVVLDENRNNKICTSGDGLGTGAHIGVYVTGANGADPFKSHGEPATPFGTFATGGDKYLDAFHNDRSLGLRGTKAADAGVDVTDETRSLIYWSKPFVVNKSWEGVDKGDYDNYTVYFRLYQVDGSSWGRTGEGQPLPAELISDWTWPTAESIPEQGQVDLVPGDTVPGFFAYGDGYYFVRESVDLHRNNVGSGPVNNTNKFVRYTGRVWGEGDFVESSNKTQRHLKGVSQGDLLYYGGRYYVCRNSGDINDIVVLDSSNNTWTLSRVGYGDELAPVGGSHDEPAGSLKIEYTTQDEALAEADELRSAEGGGHTVVPYVDGAERDGLFAMTSSNATNTEGVWSRSFGDLPSGTYYAVEADVRDANDQSVMDSLAPTYDYRQAGKTVTITNGPGGSNRVVLRKVRETGTDKHLEPLEGAVFEIERASGSKIKDESDATSFTSQKNGVFFVGELTDGVYFVHETKVGEATVEKWFYCAVDETETTMSAGYGSKADAKKAYDDTQQG